MLADALQTTFEDAVPLPEVEFVVVDLETTGGSPRDSRITEVGAVKVIGGERIGSFHALVDPEETVVGFSDSQGRAVEWWSVERLEKGSAGAA